MIIFKISVFSALIFFLTFSRASAEQLNPEQIKIINDTSLLICTSVKNAHGTRTDIQIEGDVRAQLNGLVGKLVDLGGSGKGSLSKEEFDGLSRDATATALQGDRDCRERIFDKMFDKLSATAPNTDDKPRFEHSRSVTSGQINVGCGGKVPVETATVHFGEGAKIEQAATHWANTDGLESYTQKTVEIVADKGSSLAGIKGVGEATGKPYQNIFGIPNCPGGGHGELVLDVQWNDIERN